MVELQNPSTLGIPKDQFLSQIRQCLGVTARQEPSPTHPPLAEDLADLGARAAILRSHLESTRTGLVDQFCETAARRSWNVYRTNSSEDAVGYIAELARKLEVKQVCRTTQPVMEDLPLDSALLGAGIETVAVAWNETESRDRLRARIAESGIGVTGADFAVAETGSVIVMPRNGLARLVSLVPPIHVAVVRQEELVESLDDVFLLRRLEYWRNGGEMGSYVNFITGPSRTADIEMKLVVGVHGPREVHLVMLG